MIVPIECYLIFILINLGLCCDIVNKCSCGCRIIKWLPVWFYKNQFKSGRKACRITQPTLFLSGLSDQVDANIFHKKGKSVRNLPLVLFQLIPPKMMTDLYTTCGAPVKRLARWKISGDSVSTPISFPGSLLALTMKPGLAVIIIRLSHISLMR